jgi:hypothetical protein
LKNIHNFNIKIKKLRILPNKIQKRQKAQIIFYQKGLSTNLAHKKHSNIRRYISTTFKKTSQKTIKPQKALKNKKFQRLTATTSRQPYPHSA